MKPRGADTPWGRLEDAVRNNPFQTHNGRWHALDRSVQRILHSAPFGPVEVALDYYRNNEEVWKGKKPRSLAMLHYHRLHIFLREEVQNDERLRLFSNDRGWLNPFSGEWITDVTQIGGRITGPVLAAMAKSLVKCEQARDGKLLPMEKLKRAIAGKPVETARVSKDVKKETDRNKKKTGTAAS